MDQILDHYRSMCLKKGCLDYGLTAEIYSRILLQDPEYQKALKEQYRVVLVDNLEELTPLAAELLTLLLPNLEGAMLCFCVDGGYSRFYGADPEYAL